MTLLYLFFNRPAVFLITKNLILYLLVDVNHLLKFKSRFYHVFTTCTGKHELVEALITQYADLNSSDYHGATPLHLAAQEGNQSAIVSKWRYEFLTLNLNYSPC